MPIVSPENIAAARQVAKQLAKAYNLKGVQQRAEDVLTRLRAAEEAHFSFADVINVATDEAQKIRAAVTERENELLNEIMGDATLIAQEVDELKDEAKTREAEIEKAIAEETIGEGDDAKPKFISAAARKNEATARKKVDVRLGEIKTALKIAEAKKVDPNKSAAERNRLLAQKAGTDDELKALKGQLAQAEANLAQKKIDAGKARAEYNHLTRENAHVGRLMELTSATMRALVGLEYEDPTLQVPAEAAAPTFVTPDPQAAAPAATQSV